MIAVKLNVDTSSAEQNLERLDSRFRSSIDKVHSSNDMPRLIGDGGKTSATLGTSHIKEQFEDLGYVVRNLTKDLQEAWQNGDLKRVATTSTAIESANSARQTLENEYNRKVKAEQSADNKNDPMKAMGSYFNAYMATQMVGQVIQAGELLIGSKKSLASGDYIGSQIQKEKGMGQLAGQGLGGAIGAILGSFVGAPMIGAGIGSAAGGFLGKMGGEKKEIGAAYAQQYQNALPTLDRANAAFGINKHNAAENNANGLRLYSLATQKARGTGRTSEAILNSATNLSAYGVNERHGLDLARKSALYERFYNVGDGGLEKAAGLGARYNTDILGATARSVANQGLTHGQYGEMSNAIVNALTEGLDKGFIHNADTISSSLTALQILSNGSKLWTGEQGAKRLSDLNAGFANSTSLQGTSSLMSFEAAKNVAEKRGITDYVEIHKIQEAGLGGEDGEAYFREFVKVLKETTGDNKNAQIEFLLEGGYVKNYKGGDELYNIFKNSENNPNAFADAQKYINGNVAMPSDSTNVQDLINKAANAAMPVGQKNINEVVVPAIKKATVEIEKLTAALTATNVPNTPFTNTFFENAGFPIQPLANAENPISKLSQSTVERKARTPENKKSTGSFLNTGVPKYNSPLMEKVRVQPLDTILGDVGKDKNNLKSAKDVKAFNFRNHYEAAAKDGFTNEEIKVLLEELKKVVSILGDSTVKEEDLKVFVEVLAGGS